jgi:hypothetical protein
MIPAKYFTGFLFASVSQLPRIAISSITGRPSP